MGRQVCSSVPSTGAMYPNVFSPQTWIHQWCLVQVKCAGGQTSTCTEAQKWIWFVSSPQERSFSINSRRRFLFRIELVPIYVHLYWEGCSALSSCLSPLQKVGFCNPQVGHCLPNVTPDEHAFHVACQLREWLCGFVNKSGDIRGWLLPSSAPAHLTIPHGFMLASALFLPSC